MTPTEAWVCPTCKIDVRTPFCAQCGERPIRPRDLTLRGVAERILHALTSIDGRIARAAWRLLRHPGTLAVAYMDGMRKPYAAPFQLFVLANVLFFAVQSLTGINIFGASLESHLHQQDWSAVAQSMLDHRLARTHRSLEMYAPVFDRAVVLNAKSLVILMVLPFAVLLPIAFPRGRGPFMRHLVFSLHLFAFLMLVFSLAVLAARIHVLFGGAGLRSPAVDNLLSGVNFGACVAYVYAALGPVYGASGWSRGARSLILTAAVGTLVLGYRFALFPITLYGT